MSLMLYQNLYLFYSSNLYFIILFIYFCCIISENLLRILRIDRFYYPYFCLEANLMELFGNWDAYIFELFLWGYILLLDIG